MPYIIIDPTLAKAAPILDIGEPVLGHGKDLAEMRAKLWLRLKHRTDVYDPANSDYALLDSFINDAYQDLATATEYMEQVTNFEVETDIDQPMYLLPDNVTTVIGVVREDVRHMAGSTNLLPILEGTYRRSPTSSGLPSEYVDFDTSRSKVLIVYPTPDKVTKLSVTARFEPQPLTLPEHCPYLDVAFHEAIELLARVKAHSALSEPGDTDVAHNEFLAYMQRRRSKSEIRDSHRVPGSSVPRTRQQAQRRYIRRLEDY
jgi:hypothetical protein